ncbi:hypothetical protein FQN60_015343 [Etheostoma spectabile]|uniref:cGMP-dependent protein kinase n=1 Tax=Etheostoma spectabile TaxID=54343 RepID=A0A5J5CV07_9PERO|nr:hypothetical protein FQN60_015343 [Etheostoma spectabile]
MSNTPRPPGVARHFNSVSTSTDATTGNENRASGIDENFKKGGHKGERTLVVLPLIAERLGAIPMVASQCLAMGNGSIKAPQAGETSCLASIHPEPPGLHTDVLRLRITHLEAELARRDQEFRAQELKLQHVQRELEAKISQIDKLQDAIGYNVSLGRSPPALCHHRFSVINQGSSRFHRVAVAVHRRLKAKEGVSAEPTSENFCGGLRAANFSIANTKKLINDAIMNNDFLNKVEPQHMREMVDCMYEKVYTEGQLVIQEGEPGNYLYVLADGLLEVIQNGKLLGEMRPGTAFGELAILYNCKRTATVKAVSQSHIWALDRQTFQTIMMRTTKARHEETILKKGSILFERVVVTQSTEGLAEPQEIKTLGVGDYFGEKALISEDVRSANIVCSENDTHCLVVDRDNFNQMVGTYEELQSYLKEYIDSAEAQDLRRLKEKIALLPPHQPFQELEVVATLGMGGFGRVELVKLKDEETTFALKLFRTFRDAKFVYMLLEVCLGGELWTADFGFAKNIGLGKKTWTFCGTPEYVAPEVIMNKGHDFGADCWSLGILIFELLTGNPPFAGSDPIKIYTMVLHGIEKVDFPKRIGKRPDDLIRRLCKLNPVERLGNKKNGIIDIKKHKWFQGFNWEGLRHHKLLSPLRRELKGPMDHSYFDTFPPDPEEPPDELSGWDKDF